MSNRQPNRTLSLRRSLVVWVSGAVLGWVVAVVTVYGVIRNQGDRVAESEIGAPNQEKSLATEDPADHLSPAELREMIETAPAAGKPETGATEDQDKTGEESDTGKPEATPPEAEKDSTKQNN